jgi:hypothetical protein
MSLDYSFYAETKRSGVWTAPPGFEHEEHLHQRLGAFTWIPGRSPLTALFFGPAALFPFRRELPPDRESSALFRHLDSFYDYRTDERRLSWIAYPDLLIDLWDEKQLLLGAKVPACDGDAFGNGRQPFPENELFARGWDESRVASLRAGSVKRVPVDRTFGKGRHELEAVPPDFMLDVTWLDSVSGQLGQWRAEAFRGLRRHGSDQELRVISMFS